MPDCPTPTKRRFRSKAAAVRWRRRAKSPAVARVLHPYPCYGHWHLTHNEPGWNNIPTDVDQELHAIATQSADRYPDSVLLIHGWQRVELVDAIHGRLRNKYRELRDTGQLERDSDGRVQLTQKEPQ